jgi:aryl-alcohol dehydrogenase-like predicted oxidoreductase
VGRLGLGTLTWGGETDPEEASSMLAAFRDAGGSLVCTADTFYAGGAEEILGHLLGSAADRGAVVLVGQTGGPWAARADGSRRSLLAALDASLDRLRTDHLDVWLVRGWDQETPLEETLGTLDLAVRSGRARYVGLTDVAGWQLAAVASAQRSLPGREPVVAVHAEWSLLARGVERELVPAAWASGVGVLPWSPLGRGVLTGKYRAGVPRDSRGGSERWESFVTPYLDGDAGRVVDAVLTAADGLGVSPVSVALAWLRDRPAVTAPIVGARTVGQLEAALAAEAVELPDEIVWALDEVSAPPVGYPERLGPA